MMETAVLPVSNNESNFIFDNNSFLVYMLQNLSQCSTSEETYPIDIFVLKIVFAKMFRAKVIWLAFLNKQRMFRTYPNSRSKLRLLVLSYTE